jgi:hypothetical protein
MNDDKAIPMFNLNHENIEFPLELELINTMKFEQDVMLEYSLTEY